MSWALGLGFVRLSSGLLLPRFFVRFLSSEGSLVCANVLLCIDQHFRIKLGISLIQEVGEVGGVEFSLLGQHGYKLIKVVDF